MAPVCLQCGTRMKCEKNEALGFELHEGIMPGDDMATQVKKINRVWYCDIFKCPQCKIEIMTNWAKEPVARDHEPEKKEMYLRDAVDHQIRHIYFVEK